MNNILIKPITKDDKTWITDLLIKQWGDVKIISKGEVKQADQLPGFIAYVKEDKVGLITYEMKNNICEIVSLDSLKEGIGIGTKLIGAIKEQVKNKGSKKIFLITTNDNLHALGFYQKRGFIIKTIYPNALEFSRKIKPQIPKLGMDNIPLRDEIELEMTL